MKVGSVSVSDNAAVFQIAVDAIEALDGSRNLALTDTIAVIDNTAPTLVSAVATDPTKITVTFSEDVKLNAVDLSREVELLDEDDEEIEFASPTIVEGELVLTVSDATKVVKINVTKVTSPNLVDLAGNGVATGTYSFVE